MAYDFDGQAISPQSKTPKNGRNATTSITETSTSAIAGQTESHSAFAGRRWVTRPGTTSPTVDAPDIEHKRKDDE